MKRTHTNARIRTTHARTLYMHTYTCTSIRIRAAGVLFIETRAVEVYGEGNSFQNYMKTILIAVSENRDEREDRAGMIIK